MPFKLVYSYHNAEQKGFFYVLFADQNSIYRYLDSERCNPEQIIEPEVIQSLVERGKNDGSS